VIRAPRADVTVTSRATIAPTTAALRVTAARNCSRSSRLRKGDARAVPNLAERFVTTLKTRKTCDG
jgi:hypothetical protein